jgi:hypothetical protein
MLSRVTKICIRRLPQIKQGNGGIGDSAPGLHGWLIFHIRWLLPFADVVADSSVWRQVREVVGFVNCGLSDGQM